MQAEQTETTGSQTGSVRVERNKERNEVVVRFPSLDRMLRWWLPDETVQHLRAAQREQLLAVRSLIDAAVERIDEQEQHRQARRPRRVDIEVE